MNRSAGVRWWAAALLATTVVVAALGLRSTSDRSLQTPGTGNPDLLDAIEPFLEGQRDRVAVALVTPDTTRWALYGTDRDDQYEIGSVTKAMTGALLADAVDRGEVDYDTRIETLLERLEGTEIGGATLEDLATYHSGLSLWGPDEPSPWRWFTQKVRAGNPRAIPEDEMYERAVSDPLATRGAFAYSNLGFALLGAALEQATGLTYDELLERRLLEPLGLGRTSVGRSGDRNQTRGRTERGRLSAPWNLESFAPAGGVRSDIADMATWARSLLDGDGIGNQAMDTFRADGERGSGLGWYTLTLEGRDLVWRTGQTGGFSSFAAVDRTERRAVVVLSDNAEPFDEQMLRLLDLGR